MYVWSWYLGTDHHFEYCRDALRRKRLPMIGEGLGSMITNFKKATKTNELEEKKEESVLVEGSSKEKEGVS